MSEEKVKSTHKVEVVKIVAIETHPNADTLVIAKVFGYVCLVRKDDFNVGDLGAYIVPDSVCDATRPEFAFLLDPKHPEKTQIRIKTKRLRGVMSQGLLIHAPAGAKEGDDVASLLGVTRYEPPVQISSGGTCNIGPMDGCAPRYDVEDWHRYGSLFVMGEEVIGTEKIHGANSRYIFDGEKMWVGSHEKWWDDDPTNMWWRVLRAYPAIEAFCRANPKIAVYGETYGSVQKLKYGSKQGELLFVTFDLYREGCFIDNDEARAMGKDLPWVPVLYRGSYDPVKLKELSNGPSTMPGADHIREGVVIKPVKERYDIKLGRVQLKIVSDEYLEKVK